MFINLRAFEGETHLQVFLVAHQHIDVLDNPAQHPLGGFDRIGSRCGVCSP